MLSRRINRKPSEAAAASKAEEVLRQTQLVNPEEGLALAPSGWHPVRASFEVDKVTRTRSVVFNSAALCTPVFDLRPALPTVVSGYS